MLILSLNAVIVEITPGTKETGPEWGHSFGIPNHTWYSVKSFGCNEWQNEEKKYARQRSW